VVRGVACQDHCDPSGTKLPASLTRVPWFSLRKDRLFWSVELPVRITVIPAVPNYRPVATWEQYYSLFVGVSKEVPRIFLHVALNAEDFQL
jgi:hypothetical protein